MLEWMKVSVIVIISFPYVHVQKPPQEREDRELSVSLLMASAIYWGILIKKRLFHLENEVLVLKFEHLFKERRVWFI